MRVSALSTVPAITASRLYWALVALAFLVMFVGERAEEILKQHELELMLVGAILFIGVVGMLLDQMLAAAARLVTFPE